MAHSFSNEQASQLLRELAAVLEVTGDSFFKIRAYKNAADVIEFLEEPLASIWERGELEKVKGIGKAISDKLGDGFETGRSAEVEQIKSKVPQAMFALLPIEGLGPKKAYRLTKEFGLENPQTVMDDVKKLAEDNKIAQLEGFGEKSQAVILQAIKNFSPDDEVRMRIDQADAIASEIIAYLKACPAIKEISALGSLRRRKSTIGDIDLGVSASDYEAVRLYVETYPKIKQILVSGGELVRFIHTSGQNCDVKIIDPKMWGSLLQHFTGSKSHNVSLRERALKKGWSLSEHGIKFIKGHTKEELRDKKTYDVVFKKEEEFYKYMGLDWTPPEIREDVGEIALAETGKLPTLVELKDIKGEFHTHTDYKWQSSHDYGVNTPEEIVEKALKLGYEYIGVGDHNPSASSYSDQELSKIVQKRIEKVSELNTKYDGIKVFSSLEVDIKADGSLALPSELCELFDLLIVSVHSSMTQDKATMTERVLKALEYPKVKIIGHPTGKLINKRDGFELEWTEIFAACKDKNIALEINSNPQRLDLNDALVKRAIEAGVKIVINTDSHAVEQMDYMKYGVDVARRGWCEKKDVVNSSGLSELLKWLK